MVPANDGKDHEMGIIIEAVEALNASVGRHASDDEELPYGADTTVAIADDAGLDELLVGLGVVEAADDGPD